MGIRARRLRSLGPRPARIEHPADHPQAGLLAMIDDALRRYRSGAETTSAAEVVDLLLDLRSAVVYDTELVRLLEELEPH